MKLEVFKSWVLTGGILRQGEGVEMTSHALSVDVIRNDDIIMWISWGA